jgi:hypothetical protein
VDDSLVTTLWRAARADQPWFGFRSFWATRHEWAQSYHSKPGFGGLHLYRADVHQPLDLRGDPWAVIEDRFGLDRTDYDQDARLDHELIADLAPVFAAHGHDWAVFTLHDESGADDEWIYLGEDPMT